MTRISSTIKPIELCDLMVKAEHREIKRIPNVIKKKLAEGKEVDLSKQPENFKLGTGHVIFFYDKLAYLHERYKQLLAECRERNFDVTDYNNCFEGLPEHLYNDWTPTKDVRTIVTQRVNERLQGMKAKDIRHYSEIVDVQYMLLSDD